MAVCAVGSIRVNPSSGLFFDFRYKGTRCREYTLLSDNTTNRKNMSKLLKQIEAEISAGTFSYRTYFPNSKLAIRLEAKEDTGKVVVDYRESSNEYLEQANILLPILAEISGPTFKSFADVWFAENEVRWRKSYKNTIAEIIEGHLKPEFGEKFVGQISKAEILKFRSALAKIPGRKNKESLSPSRVNYIMMTLRQILTEAADRFNFNNTYRNIKPLKIQRSDVEPFTLSEVQSILKNIREDYRNYYTVRFFTGLRTGEIDGLKWKYVDFEKRLILIRETIVRGEEEYTKTDASQRDIQMSQIVYKALQDQYKTSGGRSEFVFCSTKGGYLDYNNVTKRVWYPILRHLGIQKRRPYQTRHTAATLWLAAGENPEWIARQMGHASTEMLFKIYSRFVPNLTRQDGSAFERLLRQSGTTNEDDEVLVHTEK